MCKPEHKKPEKIKPIIITMVNYPNRKARRHPSDELLQSIGKGYVIGKNSTHKRLNHPLNKKQRAGILKKI
jgi:hypothetical protein